MAECINGCRLAESAENEAESELTILVPYSTILLGNGGEALEIETQGGFLITQIKQIGGRIFEKLLANAGIEEFNGAQGRILYILWQKDDVPIVELSRKTGLAKTSLTSMLERMENANLIMRISDQSDKRKIRVSLTETARKLSDEYNKISQDMNEVYYTGFSDEEIKAFENTLQRVLSNLIEKERTI